MAAKPTKSYVGLKIVGVLLVVSAAVAFALFTLRPVARTAVAYKNKALNEVPGSVIVEAEYIMDLKSESEGRVLSSELDPGKKVKKGEVLAQLDPAVLNLEISRLRSEYEAAKARIAIGSSAKIARDNAKDALDVLERQAVQGGVAQIDLNKARRNFDLIKMQVALEELGNTQTIEGLENTLKVKENLLQTMTITAPFDGVVSAVVARPGDLLGAKAPLATLISTSRTVEAKISEENYAGIELGQKAAVRFLVYGDTLYDATVIKKLPTADPETQRYVIHLDVKIDPEKLLPGITGEVSVIVAERDNAILIPRRALFEKRVFVVTDGRVEMRKVETGYLALDVAEILKGIAVGERVIVDELDKFRDGDRVRIEPGKDGDQTRIGPNRDGERARVEPSK